jgi:predicted metal-dependent HD superfamily phosphohydrolase
MTSFERWASLWTGLGGAAGAKRVFDSLIERYAEEHRAYHTLDHVHDCLAQFDLAHHLADYSLEVEAALWFHDVIYDTRTHDNEAQSARWASDVLQDAGIAKGTVERVADLILATRHDTAPSDDNAAIVVDVDLSILGRSRDVFDQYERLIRQEYAWVPEEVFREKRASILRTFLARETIFFTDFFQTRYEEQAQRNLARSLGQLEA